MFYSSKTIPLTYIRPDLPESEMKICCDLNSTFEAQKLLKTDISA